MPHVSSSPSNTLHQNLNHHSTPFIVCSPVGVALSRRTSIPRFCTMDRAVVVVVDMDDNLADDNKVLDGRTIHARQAVIIIIIDTLVVARIKLKRAIW